MGLTSDPNDPRLKEGQQNETGQHSIYLTLSEEDRAKGFVRPVRDTYMHVGRLLKYHSIDRMFSESEIQGMKTAGYYNAPYVAALNVVDGEGKKVGATYVTQEELDAWQKGERFGGCGTVTTMAKAIAETYAHNPKFYGATFCVKCNQHLPVNEFVWDGTNEEVGS